MIVPDGTTSLADSLVLYTSQASSDHSLYSSAYSMRQAQYHLLIAMNTAKLDSSPFILTAKQLFAV